MPATGAELELDRATKPYPHRGRCPALGEKANGVAYAVAPQCTNGQPAGDLDDAIADEMNAHLLERQLLSGHVAAEQRVELGLGQGHDGSAIARSAPREVEELLLGAAAIGRGTEIVSDRGPFEDAGSQPEKSTDHETEQDDGRAATTAAAFHPA